jgi:hypothetical protein
MVIRELVVGYFDATPVVTGFALSEAAPPYVSALTTLQSPVSVPAVIVPGHAPRGKESKFSIVRLIGIGGPCTDGAEIKIRTPYGVSASAGATATTDSSAKVIATEIDRISIILSINF